jgi:hypothetical protein
MKQAQRKIPHDHVMSPFAKLFIISEPITGQDRQSNPFSPCRSGCALIEIWYGLVKPDRF